MNIPCDVIRDLLPLYAEDLASQESITLVDEHLAACEACQKELENLKTIPIVPMQTDVNSLQRVKKAIFKRRILTAVTAMMVLLTLFFGAWEFLNASIFIPIERSLVSVEMIQGKLQISTSPRVNGYIASSDPSSGQVGLLTTMRMKNYLFPNDPDTLEGNSAWSTTIPPEDDAIAQCWYANIWDGTAAIPLFKDGDMEKPTEPVVNPRYDLFFIIGGMLAAAATLVIFSRFVKERAHTDFTITAAMLFSLSLGILLHHGGQLVEYCSGFESSPVYYLYELRDGLWPGVPLFLTILCGIKLHQWKKEDSLN